MKKILIAALVATVGVLGFFGGRVFGPLNLSPLETKVENSNSQVVQAVATQEKIVLLKLGIQGITSQEKQAKLFGFDVPGTGRSLYLQYNYSALLGVDGSKVKITTSRPHTYQLTIPKFTFLGHDGVEFHKAVEKNGVISLVTPQIDVTQMTNQVLNNETKEQHLRDNDQQLREQCTKFYEKIIKSVDPEASVALTFESA